MVLLPPKLTGNQAESQNFRQDIPTPSDGHAFLGDLRVRQFKQRQKQKQQQPKKNFSQDKRFKNRFELGIHVFCCKIDEKSACEVSNGDFNVKLEHISISKLVNFSTVLGSGVNIYDRWTSEDLLGIVFGRNKGSIVGF